MDENRTPTLLYLRLFFEIASDLHIYSALAGSNFCTRLDEVSYLGYSVVLAFAVLLIAALSQVLEFAWA